jgi:hypothetical protein
MLINYLKLFDIFAFYVIFMAKKTAGSCLFLMTARALPLTGFGLLLLERRLMTKPTPMGPAAGLRIAVLEDETLIALDLQDILIGAGAGEVIIVRDITNLADTLKLKLPDIAIVNVEPADGRATACVGMLREAAVPFFFATGVNDPAALGVFAVPVVTKPYSADAILDALKKVLENDL